MSKVYLSFSLIFILLQSNVQDPTFQWVKQFVGLFTIPPENTYSNVTADLVTTDAAGNVYTTGSFEDTLDFNPVTSVYKLNTSAGFDASLNFTKLTANGNFVWAKQLKALPGDLSTFSIKFDALGNLLVTGGFKGTVDFDPGSGINNISTSGLNYDGFILKLDAAGNFNWAKQIKTGTIL